MTPLIYRTPDERLEDFREGRQLENRLLNLIHSINVDLGDAGGGAVDSVNGQTGAVVLSAADVGALPTSYTAPVESVNGQTGEVEIDVGISEEFLNEEVSTLTFLDSFMPNGSRVIPTVSKSSGGEVSKTTLLVSAYATSGSPANGDAPVYGTSGRLRVGAPSANTDAVRLQDLNDRLSEAQRSAIDALTSESSIEDVIAALQAGG